MHNYPVQHSHTYSSAAFMNHKNTIKPDCFVFPSITCFSLFGVKAFVSLRNRIQKHEPPRINDHVVVNGFMCVHSDGFEHV